MREREGERERERNNNSEYNLYVILIHELASRTQFLNKVAHLQLKGKRRK